MRAVIQRVTRAAVYVDGELKIGESFDVSSEFSTLFSSLLDSETEILHHIWLDYKEFWKISSIGPGLCALIGIADGDKPDDIDYIVRKLVNLRVFPDDNNYKRWDKSVKDNGYEILCVSQFTLFGIPKGNKLDFHRSMGAPNASDFYEIFLNTLRFAYAADKVKDGKFGAYMKVVIEDDGPVTICLDSTART